MIGGFGGISGFGGGSPLGGVPPAPATQSPIVIAQPWQVDLYASQVSASYAPDSEGNLLGWFDFQDPATYTVVGSTITALKNKASGVSWTNGGTATPFEVTGLNGHPCVHPTAIAHRWDSTEAALLALGDTTSAAKPYSFYYVWRADVLSAASYVFAWANSGQAADDIRGFGQSSQSTGRYGQHIVNGGTAVVSSTAATDTTTAHVLCWHGSVNHSFKLDGSADAPANSVRSVVGITPNRMSLFARPATSIASNAQGRCGEVLIFSADHDSTTAGRVSAYLKAKWGTP